MAYDVSIISAGYPEARPTVAVSGEVIEIANIEDGLWSSGFQQVRKRDGVAFLRSTSADRNMQESIVKGASRYFLEAKYLGETERNIFFNSVNAYQEPARTDTHLIQLATFECLHGLHAKTEVYDSEQDSYSHIPSMAMYSSLGSEKMENRKLLSRREPGIPIIGNFSAVIISDHTKGQEFYRELKDGLSLPGIMNHQTKVETSINMIRRLSSSLRFSRVPELCITTLIVSAVRNF